MDVYFYEAFAEEVEGLRQYLSADLRAGFTDKTIQESGDTQPPAGLISIRTQSLIPAGWGNSLRGVLSRSTGYDHIRAWWRQIRDDLPAGYLPHYCSRAVAEQGMLLWSALLRKLPRQIRQFHGFERDGLTGGESAGKNLLVVGVGNIGSKIATIGRGLDMHVRGVDLVEKHPQVEYTTIEAGLPWADIVVCAMNLTPDNVGYFDHDRLKTARPGAIFINIARGECSPPSVLLRLLREQRLGAVGLDVYDHESELAIALRSGKTTADDSEQVRAVLQLAERPNVILTPHNAFNTVEAVQRKSEQSVRQVRHFLTHGAFLWPVPVA